MYLSNSLYPYSWIGYEHGVGEDALRGTQMVVIITVHCTNPDHPLQLPCHLAPLWGQGVAVGTHGMVEVDEPDV